MESKLLRPLSQAVALALAAGGAHAASITVTDGGDAGTTTTCTLRQAIQSANTDSASGSACTAGSGADTITFAPALANSTIALQYGQLLVYSSVTISGSGQTIQAARNSRVMSINHSGNTAPTVNLTDLTLTGGNYSGPGAGLAISYSTAPLRPVTRQHRHASQRKAPAPPPSYAPIVSLDQVTISNNTSNVTAGGLFIDAATVTVNQSTISGNSLTPSQNQGAGGVFITSTYYYGYGSAVTVTDSTISGNSVSGSRSYETGGVYVYGSSLSVTNSTIAGNSASGNTELAGGLSVRYYGAAAVVNNSTITGNTVNSNANVVTGGILVGTGYANLGLYNTILSANQIARLTAPTIVAVGQPDLFVANGSNVIAQSNLMGSALSGRFTGNGNVFSDVPGLATLANNGGPTLTMKPLPGSPTLGAGNIALIPGGVTTDQRGAGYARVVNGSLDLGSVEAAAAPAGPAAQAVPALSHWAMLALGGLLGLFGLRKRRRSG